MQYTAIFAVTGGGAVALTGADRGSNMGPISDASGKIIQTIEGLRAAQKNFVDRGNEFSDITFETAWVIDGNSSPSTPLAWLANHRLALQGQGTLTISEGTADVFIPSCVIEVRVLTPIGASMTLKYHCRGGLLTTGNPNRGPTAD